MKDIVFSYLGNVYPSFIKQGNAIQFIEPVASHFCRGEGFDVGAGRWPLSGATPIDLDRGGNAMSLPSGKKDFVFSSHCLEHLPDYVGAIQHWISRIRPGGVLFLYLPHPDMTYWLPQNNRKHLHTWYPRQIANLLKDLGLVNVIVSERDMYWSFSAVGFVPGDLRSMKANNTLGRLYDDGEKVLKGDPMMLPIFRRFGPDVFRRSSYIDGLQEFMDQLGVRGDRCVEIGTFNGITAICLSKYFKEVVSIDVLPNTMKHEIAQFAGVKNIRFVDIADNNQKREFLKDLSFDFAYVDGDHQNDTQLDWDLVNRCGRVLFHEYWENQPSVKRLVDKIVPRKTFGKFAYWER